MKMPTISNALFLKKLLGILLVALSCSVCQSNCYGQATSVGEKYNHLVPGEVGNTQLLKYPDTRGHMQPVQVYSDKGVQVSVLNQERFVGKTDKLEVGMMVGNVYRLKLTHLPGKPGVELFPSVELIHRTYAPDGLATRFPVKVEIASDDIQTALEGGYVVKVVYLENPEFSRVQPRIKGAQPTIDVGPAQQPLSVAKMLGRPIAILRMGSKVPLKGSDEMKLSWGPVHVLPKDPNRNKPIAFDLNNQKNAMAKFDYVPFNNRPRQGESKQWNMEHVFDGGDRDVEVRVDENWNVSGLETEDTVAHFDTLDGRRLVSASNRVAIYSPQFSSVRQVKRILAANSTLKVGRSGRSDILAGQQRNVPATTTLQQEQPLAARKANHVEGMHQQMRVSWSNSQLGVYEARDNLKAHQNIGTVGYQVYQGSQKAWIAKSEIAAVAWGGVKSVQAMANFQTASIMDRAEAAASVTEAHPPTNKPKLQVIKMADKSYGKAGDIINFTLRFKNIGDQKIGNVTLLDNLPERLEYVAESAKCSLKGKFYTRINKKGSLLLRWDIEKPMKINDSGVITFRCRVK